MQKIDHTLFVHTLKAHGITQKAFAEYAKIPYDTVTGWKKKGKVPAYAMVILKDMAYRMRLDEQTRHALQRRHKRGNFEVIGLGKAEQKRVEAAFWGTNQTAGEIIEKIRKGDEYLIKQYNDNIPDEVRNHVKTAQIKTIREINNDKA